MLESEKSLAKKRWEMLIKLDEKDALKANENDFEEQADEEEHEVVTPKPHKEAIQLKKILDSVGVGNVAEAIERFRSQKATVESLAAQKIKNEEKIAGLKKRKIEQEKKLKDAK